MGDMVIVVPGGTRRVLVDDEGIPWAVSGQQWHARPLVIRWSQARQGFPPLHLPNGTVVVVVQRGTPQYWDVLLTRTEAMVALGEVHPASARKL